MRSRRVNRCRCPSCRDFVQNALFTWHGFCMEEALASFARAIAADPAISAETRMAAIRLEKAATERWQEDSDHAEAIASMPV